MHFFGKISALSDVRQLSASQFVDDDVLEIRDRIVRSEESTTELKKLNGRLKGQNAILLATRMKELQTQKQKQDPQDIKNKITTLEQEITMLEQEIIDLQGYVLSPEEMRRLNSQLIRQKPWGCTKVCIRDAILMPADSPGTVTSIDGNTPLNDKKRYFCYDFCTHEKYVQFTTTTFGLNVGDTPDTQVTKLKLKRNGERIVKHEGTGTPLPHDVEIGIQMFNECNEVLKTNMAAIKWLETCPPVKPENVFRWLNGFQHVVRPRLRKFDAPGMQVALSRMLVTDPTNPERLPVDGNQETADDHQSIQVLVHSQTTNRQKILNRIYEI